MEKRSKKLSMQCEGIQEKGEANQNGTEDGDQK